MAEIDSKMVVSYGSVMARFVVCLALALMVAGTGTFGTDSASATVLCEVNESPCSGENVLEDGMAFSWSAQFGFDTPPCVGGAGGKITDVGGEGEAVKAEMTSWGSACNGPQICGTTAKNLPYNMEFTGSGGSGAMVLSDPTEIKLERTCIPPPGCIFSTTKAIGFEFAGGEPAVMTATGVPVVAAPAGCPTTISLRLEAKSPVAKGLFLVGGPAPPPATRLCKSTTSPCPKAIRHPIGTAIEGTLEGSSVFEFLYEAKLREPACEAGGLAGETTALGTPLIAEVSSIFFSKCGAGVCAVEAQSLPYKAEIEKTSGGNGTLALVSGGSGPPKIEVNCGKSFRCVYKATSVSFAVTGSSTVPKLAVSQTLEKDAASETECGSTMTWKATYKVTKPTPLFVT